MAGISDYERQRRINVQENRRVLESLGLLKPFCRLPARNKADARKEKPLKRKREREEERVKTPKVIENSVATPYSENNRRKSLRIKGITPEHGMLVNDADVNDSDKDATFRKKSSYVIKRENIFGEIPGIPVGTTWLTRLECSQDGVHSNLEIVSNLLPSELVSELTFKSTPTVAGIHGSETEGCYSLALSGGYEDDIDLGDSFTYTGEGGRDLKGTKSNPKNLRTAPQSKDQTLTKGNMALSKNVENRRPVRVIRGYKLAGVYAPEQGYRYDGLYKVERYWQSIGLSGFKVYKFVLSRCSDQEPSPWLLSPILGDKFDSGNSEERCWESDASR